MRTTLTLEPDVAVELKKFMAKQNLTLKGAVNQALRAGLKYKSKAAKYRHRVQPWACNFKPGIDLDKLNQLVDELEAEEFAKKYFRQ
ncbi:MAG: hypothetical protein HY235_08595 [Acidobacteria bacterium]|nr:hypothetical protein [Acidobacteriota bacterium]